MRCELVAPGSKLWNEALAHVRHDLYQLPGYATFSSIHEEPGEPLAFIAEDDGCWFLTPLIVRPLPADVAGRDGLYDAVSPKFYAGPVLGVTPCNQVEQFATEAIAGFREALAGRNVISAFIRMHPLYTPDLRAFDAAGPVVDHGDAVSIDLSLTPEELWRQTRANHRRDINKARRAGYTFRVDSEWERLDEFVAIYAETMERLDAVPSWRLSSEYFLALREQVGDHVKLGMVELDGELACGALLSEVGPMVEYHLGGTLDRHLNMRPSKLLIHEATLWSKDRGASIFHLAGSLRRGDSLQRFKLGFTPLVHRVLSWRVVTDELRYAELEERWEQRHRHQADAPDAFFPAYRKPPPQYPSHPAGHLAHEAGDNP